jgi:hypothetical protein
LGTYFGLWIGTMMQPSITRSASDSTRNLARTRSHWVMLAPVHQCAEGVPIGA